jgi:ATP-dependent 26S proteasome regulatory subunit
MDEYRKHSHSIEDWHLIAASKIYSQWSEFFQSEADREIERLKERIKHIESKHAYLKDFVSLCVNSYKMVNNKTTPENVLNILQNRAGQLLEKEAKDGE